MMLCLSLKSYDSGVVSGCDSMFCAHGSSSPNILSPRMTHKNSDDHGKALAHDYYW